MRILIYGAGVIGCINKNTGHGNKSLTNRFLCLSGSCSNRSATKTQPWFPWHRLQVQHKEPP